MVTMKARPPLVWGPTETLSGTVPVALWHYLSSRGLGTGDELSFVCGDDDVYRLRIVGLQQVEVVERRPAEANPTVPVTLYVGALKGEQMTYLIQHVTELGLTRLVPMETERSIRRLPFKSQPRWQQTAWDGAAVCGRSRPVVVAPGMRLAQALDEAQGGVLFQERAPDLPEASQVLPASALFVGPEDGFSDAEVAAAVAAGVQCCTLGPRMLRALTAAVAATTLALYFSKGSNSRE